MFLSFLLTIGYLQVSSLWRLWMLPVLLPEKQLPVLCYSWEGRIAGGKKREVDLQQIALIMVSLAYIRQFLFPLPPLFLGIPFINISWLFTTSSFMFTSAASITSTINLITSLFCLRCRYIDDNKQFFCGENITYLMFNLSNADTELYENSAFGQLWLVKVCEKFLLFENVSVESTFSGSVYILLPLLDIKLWIDTSCWMEEIKPNKNRKLFPRFWADKVIDLQINPKAWFTSSSHWSPKCVTTSLQMALVCWPPIAAVTAKKCDPQICHLSDALWPKKGVFVSVSGATYIGL